jgi:hypothetical protein
MRYQTFIRLFLGIYILSLLDTGPLTLNIAGGLGLGCNIISKNDLFNPKKFAEIQYYFFYVFIVEKSGEKRRWKLRRIAGYY